jgi:DNA-binding transcriptional LysR family regulator
VNARELPAESVSRSRTAAQLRKAAEDLYLTQPAVTLQVKTLEEELGIKLFHRSSKGVALTEAGSLLLGYVDQLHRLAVEAETALSDLRGEATGGLVLGASTTIAQYVLPRILAEFSRRHPAIQLQVFSANTERIVEGVSSGRFGLGLIEGPALRRDVTVEPWFEDELFLVLPAGHEWAELKEIATEKIVDAPLVMRERGSGTRHIVERGLQKSAFAQDPCAS